MGNNLSRLPISSRFCDTHCHTSCTLLSSISLEKLDLASPSLIALILLHLLAHPCDSVLVSTALRPSTMDFVSKQVRIRLILLLRIASASRLVPRAPPPRRLSNVATPSLKQQKRSTVKELTPVACFACALTTED